MEGFLLYLLLSLGAIMDMCIIHFQPILKTRHGLSLTVFEERIMTGDVSIIRK